MKKKITDPVEQWKAVLAIGANDIFQPDYPDALVDAELREAGLDPKQVGAEGEAFVKKLLAERGEASRKASTTRLRSRITSEELVRRILRFDEDLLRDDYPKELVDAEPRESGADPEEIGRRGEAFVKKLMAERAEAENRDGSRTRLRSPAKATSSLPPTKTTISSLPPVRPNAPSETGPLDDGE